MEELQRLSRRVRLARQHTGGQIVDGCYQVYTYVSGDYHICATTLTEILRPTRPQRKIILCTYQSLDVIRQTQQQGGPVIDLAVCDEAHRTLGILDQNYWTSIHTDDYVHARKRLYMTATPRLAKLAESKW